MANVQLLGEICQKTWIHKLITYEQLDFSNAVYNTFNIGPLQNQSIFS